MKHQHDISSLHKNMIFRGSIHQYILKRIKTPTRFATKNLTSELHYQHKLEPSTSTRSSEYYQPNFFKHKPVISLMYDVYMISIQRKYKSLPMNLILIRTNQQSSQKWFSDNHSNTFIKIDKSTHVSNTKYADRSNNSKQSYKSSLASYQTQLLKH